MSGGHFDYLQHHVGCLADAIQAEIDKKEYEFSEQTWHEFSIAVLLLREAAIYAQRIAQARIRLSLKRAAARWIAVR